MKKHEFMNKYKALTAAERADVRNHWSDVYKGAVFVETMKEAERRLLWMKEAEA